MGGPKVNSGDLQPLICIVDVTIAQVFPVNEAMTRHRQGRPAGRSQVRDRGRGGAKTKNSANTGRGTDGEGVTGLESDRFWGGSGYQRGCLWCTESAE